MSKHIYKYMYSTFFFPYIELVNTYEDTHTYIYIYIYIYMYPMEGPSRVGPSGRLVLFVPLGPSSWDLCSGPFSKT